MPCRLEDGDATISPDRCPITNMMRACWKRDCTTEEKKDELPEGIDWRMTTHYNVKRINDLEKKVQELELLLDRRIVSCDITDKDLICRVETLERKYKEHTPKLYKADENIREEIWDLRTRIKEHAKGIHELKCKVWGP